MRLLIAGIIIFFTSFYFLSDLAEAVPQTANPPISPYYVRTPRIPLY